MIDPIDALRDLDAARLRADYQGWRDEPAARHLGEPRKRAITVVMDALFDQPLEDRLAARTWSFFRHVLAQRETLTYGQRLERADACAAAGYLALGADLAPPLVCLDPIEAPQSYARGALRADARGLPIPIVFVPPAYLTCPWLLTTVHHEVGHALDRELGVSRGLASRVELAIGGAASERARAVWRRWLVEIVCDAFALRASGPAFACTLVAVLERLGTLRDWDDDGAHPPAAIRLPLLFALLRAADVPRAVLAPLDPIEARVRALAAELAERAGELARHVEPIAELVMNAWIARSDQPLARLGPDAAADGTVIAATAAEIVAGNAPVVDVRIAPAAAQLAVLASSRDATAAKAAEVIDVAKAPEWAGSPRQWDSLRERAQAMTATIVGGDGRKVPPDELLRAHDAIAFVGATHHQLAAALIRARGARGARRWRRIEVFFTADAALAGMRSARGDLAAEKRVAMSALVAALAGAEAWTIYEVDVPFYFASYWDVDREDGRIHVSPYIWGEDVATCPAIDYVRGRTPSPAFLAYARGLDELRRSARRLASG
jgi:hypothetical protein